MQWYPREALPAPIASAVYSLGCLLVYAGFRDGAIGIFEAESLTLQCWIAPSAYVPSSISRYVEFQAVSVFCLSGTFNSGNKRLVFVASLVSALVKLSIPRSSQHILGSLTRLQWA